MSTEGISDEERRQAETYARLAVLVVKGLETSTTYGHAHYEDDKIRISYRWPKCDPGSSSSVTVDVVFKRWFSKSYETVLFAFDYRVSTYRPGKWSEYLKALAEESRLILDQREKEKQVAAERRRQESRETHFSPIDDTGVF